MAGACVLLRRLQTHRPLPTLQTIITQDLGNTVLQDFTNSITREHSRELSYISFEKERQYISSRKQRSTCKKDEIGNDIGCNPYIRLDYRYSGQITKYMRTYTDVFTAFAQFGGFKELLFSLVSTFVYFSYSFFSRFLLNMEVLGVTNPRILIQILRRQKNSKAGTSLTSQNSKLDKGYTLKEAIDFRI